MKTILLHVQDSDNLVSRLEAALSLARAFSAHLTCLHVTPIEAYTAVGAFDGAVMLAGIRDALEQGQAAVRASVEQQLASEDVSWDYQQITGHVAITIMQQASLADLLVTGRESQYLVGRRGTQIGLIGDLLHRCRVPSFIPGESTHTLDPVGPVLIAWDGSIEAANALRASIAFLKASSQVFLLHVQEPAKEDYFPDTRALAYLSRHGVHADVRTASLNNRSIAATIVDEAIALGASTIVMGSYHHSRIGQLLFGGVTRSLLLSCPISLMMSH